MVDFAELFAAEMRRRREELGLAQEELGARLGGLDRNSVSRLERGSLNITIEKAEAIAMALNASLAEMLGEIGPPNIKDVPGTSFGNNVRLLRTKLDLTQRQLAARMDVDRNLVSNIESGKRTPTLRTVQLFCKGLDVTPSQILHTKAAQN